MATLMMAAKEEYWLRQLKMASKKSYTLQKRNTQNDVFREETQARM